MTVSSTVRRDKRINTDDHMLCTCRQPELHEAWVPRWPFRASYCQNCGEVSLTVGWLLSQIWRYVVCPFWDGRVTVNKGRRWSR